MIKAIIKPKRVKKNRVILEKSVFTPCEFNCSKTPIWQISSGKTDIDYDKQTITYRNLFFEVKFANSDSSDKS